ncbi:myosin-M heavy chain-like [Liolophura sinensis]|uniref:myosin-M heavy chain-like n=1 Tax=Liolophura sinensis TaxID=3198878 RepID=UPI003158621F
MLCAQKDCICGQTDTEIWQEATERKTGLVTSCQMRKRSISDISNTLFAMGRHTEGAPQCGSCKADHDTCNCYLSHCNCELCTKCEKKQSERKRTIEEILDTEIRYGQDLQLLKEEFLHPLQSSELLSKDQLMSIFLNLEELIDLNSQMTSELSHVLRNAQKLGDNDYKMVGVGDLFLRSTSLLLAFESYCINQAQASAILNQLEKEKESLHNFLESAQTENSRLRRMSLKSFLVCPVQRLTKYPLLLSRLAKATSSNHADFDSIIEAQKRIEDIIDHINTRTRLALSPRRSLKLKRKRSLLKRSSLCERMELKRVALEHLGWENTYTTDTLVNNMQFAQSCEVSARKSKHTKFCSVFSVFLTLHESSSHTTPDGRPSSPKSTPVAQAALVLLREKGGKYVMVRDPFFLEKCVILESSDSSEMFEILDNNNGETYVFKTESLSESQVWVYHLKRQSRTLGRLTRRRNALPDITLQNIT